MKQVKACLKVVLDIHIMNIRDLELVHREWGRGPIETAIRGDRGATYLRTALHLDGSRSAQRRLQLASQIICEAKLFNSHLVHDTHYLSRLISRLILAALFRIHGLSLILPLKNALDHGELKYVILVSSLRCSAFKSILEEGS